MDRSKKPDYPFIQSANLAIVLKIPTNFNGMVITQVQRFTVQRLEEHENRAVRVCVRKIFGKLALRQYLNR
jgi:hypothetical protein